jgi:hypothetical protein
LGVPVTSVMVEGEVDVERGVSAPAAAPGPPPVFAPAAHPNYPTQQLQPQPQPPSTHYGGYPTQAPKRSTPVALIATAAVAVVVVLGIVGFVVNRDDSPTSSSNNTAVAANTVAPVSTSRPTQSTLAPAESAYPGFKIVSDNSGRIRMQVPESWVDVDGSALVDSSGNRFPQLRASPNLTSALVAYDVSGIAVILVDGAAAAAEAANTRRAQRPEGCTYIRTSSTWSRALSGEVDEYDNCDGLGTRFYAGGLTTAAGDLLVITSLQLIPDELDGFGGTTRQNIEETLRIR